MPLRGPLASSFHRRSRPPRGRLGFAVFPILAALLFYAPPRLPRPLLSGGAALVFTEKGSNYDSADSTSYVTSFSLTASANRLYTLGVYVSGTSPIVTAVSGGGLGSWALVKEDNGSGRSISLWRALSASPGAGAAITITVGSGSGINGCAYGCVEVQNVDTSGSNGSGAIAGTPVSASGTATSGAATMGAYGAAGNRPLAALGISANTAITPELTGGTNSLGASPNTSFLMEWSASTQDTTPSFSWTGSNAFRTVACEIKNAVSAQTVVAGQPTESDSALAPTRQKRLTSGQPSSSASALAPTRQKSRTAGQPSSSASALAASRQKRRTVGQASSSASALAPTRQKRRTAGQASSSSSAMAPTRRKLWPAAQPSEADVALAASYSGGEDLSAEREEDPVASEGPSFARLSASQKADVSSALIAGHDIRTRLQILDSDEEPRFDTDRIIDGGVSFDLDQTPSADLDITILDPTGWHFADAPAEEVIEARRFVRLIYEVKAGSGWHRFHVFTGPLTSERRQGAEVQIRAASKEILLLEPYTAWSSYGAGKKKALVDAIRDLAALNGEHRFRLPHRQEDVKKHLALARFEEPWPQILRAAAKMGAVPFFDGSGYLTLRPRSPERVGWTFDGSNVLSTPEFSSDFTQIRNQAAVEGPDPEGPQKPTAISVSLPPAHPLSPEAMARAGHPRRAIVAEQIESRRMAVLKEHGAALLSTFTTEAAFDALPVAHLHLGMLCRLVGTFDGIATDVRFPLRRFFLPATAMEPMTIGYWRRLPLNWGKHRLAVKRIDPWGVEKKKKARK